MRIRFSMTYKSSILKIFVVVLPLPPHENILVTLMNASKVKVTNTYIMITYYILPKYSIHNMIRKYVMYIYIFIALYSLFKKMKISPQKQYYNILYYKIDLYYITIYIYKQNLISKV